MRATRLFGRIGLLLAALAAAAPTARAECRVALALALDMSSSVDSAEDRLQREGLARALTSPEVMAAIFALEGAHVSIAAYEWSGRYQQVPVLGWTPLLTPEDVQAAAARIAGSRRVHDDLPTAMGYAIGHAARLFRAGPPCTRMKLDVSGDGRNNEGFPPELAFRHFPLDGVTVNGLAILDGDPSLSDYFRAQVIRGPGAFVIEADDFADFERAMRAKLVRELGLPRLGAAGQGKVLR
jgi:hypothetical protein